MLNNSKLYTYVGTSIVVLVLLFVFAMKVFKRGGETLGEGGKEQEV